LASAHQPEKSQSSLDSLGTALFELLFERHPALLE
jgi:hypothetical protein